MEKIGVEALVAICKEGNGQERVEETYPLSGAGQFVSIQNDNMAEMQGRMIRLLTMLMKKDVVLSCVPEVMGVVEERLKKEREARERGQRRVIPEEMRESVDALNEASQLFVMTAHLHSIQPTLPSDALRTENLLLKAELERSKQQVKEAERQKNAEKTVKEEMTRREAAERRRREQAERVSNQAQTQIQKYKQFVNSLRGRQVTVCEQYSNYVNSSLHCLSALLFAW